MYDWAIYEGKQKRDDYWRGERSRVSKAFEEYKKTNPYATQAEMEDYFKREAGGDAWMFQPQSEVLGKLASNNLAAKDKAEMEANLAEIDTRAKLDKTLQEQARSYILNAADTDTPEMVRAKMAQELNVQDPSKLSFLTQGLMDRVGKDVFFKNIERIKEMADTFNVEIDADYLAEALNVPLAAKKRYFQMYQGYRANQKKKNLQNNYLKIVEAARSYAASGTSNSAAFLGNAASVFGIEITPALKAEIKAIFDQAQAKLKKEEDEKLATRRSKVYDDVLKYFTSNDQLGLVASMKDVDKTEVEDYIRNRFSGFPDIDALLRDGGAFANLPEQIHQERLRAAQALKGAAKDKAREEQAKQIRTQRFDSIKALADSGVTDPRNLSSMIDVHMRDADDDAKRVMLLALREGIQSAVAGYKLDVSDIMQIASSSNLGNIISTRAADPNQVAQAIRNSAVFREVSKGKSADDARSAAQAKNQDMFRKYNTWDLYRTNEVEKNENDLFTNWRNAVADVTGNNSMPQRLKRRNLEALKTALKTRVEGLIDGFYRDRAIAMNGPSGFLNVGEKWGGENPNYSQEWEAELKTKFADADSEISLQLGAMGPPADAATVAAGDKAIERLFNVTSKRVAGNQATYNVTGVRMPTRSANAAYGGWNYSNMLGPNNASGPVLGGAALTQLASAFKKAADMATRSQGVADANALLQSQNVTYAQLEASHFFDSLREYLINNHSR